MKEISIWDANFIVIDVETTGNNPRDNRIIDIAAVAVNNGQIVEEFSSLVNPHQFIPFFITQMTGITNEAVFYAPEPAAIAPKLLGFFHKPNAVFVAHNANFDFSFVNETFYRIHLPKLDIPVLDTLKLAKRLLADAQKKSVGNLAHYFGIRIRNRHTAMGDAKATAKILLNLLDIAQEEHEITNLEELLALQNKKLSYFVPPKSMVEEFQAKLDKLPDAPGVYYFLDKRDKVIYVGKARSLRNRVSSYFQPGNITSYKLKELTKNIADIRWEETFNELSALLLEAKEIKKFKPKFNFVGLRLRSLPFLRITTEELFPKVEVTFNTELDGEYYGPFLNKQVAELIKEIIDKNFKLVKCDKDFVNNTDEEPCLYYQISRCLAPCAFRKEPDFGYKYNNEVLSIRNFLSGFASGLKEELIKKMEEYSQTLEYEKANDIKKAIYSIEKVFNNSEEYFNSLNKQNFILVLPHQFDDNFYDVYLFKFNRLVYHKTLGRKAILNPELIQMINNVYFNGFAMSIENNLEFIEEIKITNSWLAKNKESGTIIYVDKYQNKDEIIEQLARLDIKPIEIL